MSNYRVMPDSTRWCICSYRLQGTRWIIWAFYPDLVIEIVNDFYCEVVAIWHYLERAKKQQKHVADPNAAPSARNIANMHGNGSKKTHMAKWVEHLLQQQFHFNPSSFPQIAPLLFPVVKLAVQSQILPKPVSGMCIPRNQSAKPFFSLDCSAKNPSWHTLNYIRSKVEN